MVSAGADPAFILKLLVLYWRDCRW